MPEQFISKRVKVSLHDATMTRKGESRFITLQVSVNLSEGNTLATMPEWITANYSLMAKSRNKTKKSDLDEKLENMSMGFYSTERIRSKFFSQVNEGTLSGFKMLRFGKEENPEIRLTFSIMFAGRREIHDWTYDHKTADFWMDFEQQQGTLDMEGAEGSQDDAGEAAKEVEDAEGREDDGEVHSEAYDEAEG